MTYSVGGASNVVGAINVGGASNVGGNSNTRIASKEEGLVMRV